MRSSMRISSDELKDEDIDVTREGVKARYAITRRMLSSKLKKRLIERGRIDQISCLPVMATECYWDDLSGKKLKPNLVKKAREEEMEEFNKHMVYKKVPLAKAWSSTGKKPIAVRWVDVNKGDEQDPNYRSRLVAKEIKKYSDWSLFAATPPWEAIKLLFSLAVTEGRGWKDTKEKGKKIEVSDVRRAYFYAKARRQVFVELPDEDSQPGMCGELGKSMYGTRDAANNWEQEYCEFLKSVGFARGASVPCSFHNAKRDMCLVVHGDDFTILGYDSDLDWLKVEMKKKFEIKTTRIGPARGDDKSLKLLNRIVEWTPQGIAIEGDQRHAELVVKDLELELTSKSVSTPYDGTDKAEDEEELSPAEATQYRSNVARGNFMSQDRSDIQYTVKELSRGMSSPKKCDLTRLKRLARYLIKAQRVKLIFRYLTAEEAKEITVHSDTDFAGCRKTRKSTSGGVLMISSHLIKSWSSTQTVIALSSGEAEYYGMVKAAAQGIGTKAMLLDLGVTIEEPIEVKSDASAAIGIAQRRGMGKVRHIETNQLWLQERVATGSIKITKIGTHDNLADQLTKPVTEEKMRQRLEGTHQKLAQGRHPLAPKVAS
jgi:hypothetical protein